MHTKWPKALALLFFTLWATQCSKPGGAPEFLQESLQETPSTNAFDDLKNPQSVQKLVYHVSSASGPLSFQVLEPVWVTGFASKVIDSKGNLLPGRLIQKALLFNRGEENPLCAQAQNGNPFAMATSTLTPVVLPEGFGYPLMPQDQLLAKVAFNKAGLEEYSDVIFSFELTAIPMGKAKTIKDLQPFLLDQDPCDYKPASIEPGAFVEKNKTFTLPDAGSLIIANGLLSDYGVSVSLAHQTGNNLTAVPFWRAEALLDEERHIINLSDNPFLDPSGKKMKKGDKLTLGIAFDNFSDAWHNEATGSALVYIAPD